MSSSEYIRTVLLFVLITLAVAVSAFAIDHATAKYKQNASINNTPSVHSLSAKNTLSLQSLSSTQLNRSNHDATVHKATTDVRQLKGVKGIYLTQYTLENTSLLHYLIKHAKASGIDTFIVDMELPSKRYQQNVALLKQNNINYVARIIMFPGGGTPEQINNPAIWQKKYRLVQQAVDWGAKQIQLDYIRFNTKQKPSPENARKILGIIQWYKDKLSGQNIPLQVDVFGIASFGESKYIGQNIKLFSQAVDAVCPMVYPSHYVPFAEHFKTPYETVYTSLKHIKRQFGAQQLPMQIYAYIELTNYHYPMTREKTLEYIKAQIRAVDAANADGWYAWSPHNRYDNLFRILEGRSNLTDNESMNKTDHVNKLINPKLSKTKE